MGVKLLQGTEAGALFGALVGTLRDLGFSRGKIEHLCVAVNDEIDRVVAQLDSPQPPKPPGD